MRLSFVRALIAILLGLLLPGIASAHKPSDSYLKLRVEGHTIVGQWDIALRDLDYAIGLDSNQDNAITWGEVKAKHDAIAAYALSRLTLASKDRSCKPEMRRHLIDDHSDGAYAVLEFEANCPEPLAALAVGYRLFFDIDPMHRGLLNLTVGDATQTAIFSADGPNRQFELGGVSWTAAFGEYVREGVVHIWTGYDHMLFLLSLLLPGVLVWARGWIPARNVRESVWSVTKVVTAFTVAHSITLSLAALGFVSLPSRLVESAIAASVVLAALNNVFPVVRDARWGIAFAFGLIHGFGFASVLNDLGLPHGALLVSLVAFNLGVEIGQLAIVAALLPIAFLLRETRFYRQAIMFGGSSAIALVAAVWLAQRAFNLQIMPSFG